MTVNGSLLIRPTIPAVGSAWRGLAVYLSSDFAYPDTVGADPIPFDTVVADTDSIYNGTNGGVVPVGMAGRWRVAGQVYCFAGSPVTGGLGGMLLEVNGSITTQSYYGTDAGVSNTTFPFSPRILVLAEGDLVQIKAGSSAGGGPKAGAFDTYMSMEWLGPA